MTNTCPAWRRLFYWFITRVYFARITILNPERRPRKGPVLYLGLHRNGAVDGFVYNQALGGPTFLISTQLTKSWFARLFFTGIEVTRSKDEGDRAGNELALQACVELLHRGGALFVFPEGTSSLGPRHLPFKTGALWLILDYLEKHGPGLNVVPVGIHYECPWAFRAKVEVVLGDPLDLRSIGVSAKKDFSEFDPASGPGVAAASSTARVETGHAVAAKPASEVTLTKLRALKRMAQAGLEAVGINVVSAEYQTEIQKLAYVSTLATPRSCFASLKALERDIPKPILDDGKALEAQLASCRLWLHQGVPLVPMGSILLYILALLISAPLVLAAGILNAPALMAGYWAGKRFPDDLNVVSLWKILVGLPVFILWAGVVCALCACTAKTLWLFSYVALTWIGLHLYYRVKKLAVAVHNGLLYPKLRPAMLRFREIVLSNMPSAPLEIPRNGGQRKGREIE